MLGQHVAGAEHGHRHDRHPAVPGQPDRPGVELADPPVRAAGALRVDDHRAAGGQRRAGRGEQGRVGAALTPADRQDPGQPGRRQPAGRHVEPVVGGRGEHRPGRRPAARPAAPRCRRASRGWPPRPDRPPRPRLAAARARSARRAPSTPPATAAAAAGSPSGRRTAPSARWRPPQLTFAPDRGAAGVRAVTPAPPRAAGSAAASRPGRGGRRSRAASVPASFTPAWRLTIDSSRSPSTPPSATASTRPGVTVPSRVSTSTAPSTAPTSPPTVLFGLSGDSGRRAQPNRRSPRPPHQAATSVAAAAKQTRNASSHSTTRWASDQQIQIEPKAVNAARRMPPSVSPDSTAGSAQSSANSGTRASQRGASQASSG